MERRGLGEIGYGDFVHTGTFYELKMSVEKLNFKMSIGWLLLHSCWFLSYFNLDGWKKGLLFVWASLVTRTYVVLPQMCLQANSLSYILVVTKSHFSDSNFLSIMFHEKNWEYFHGAGMVVHSTAYPMPFLRENLCFLIYGSMSLNARKRQNKAPLICGTVQIKIYIGAFLHPTKHGEDSKPRVCFLTKE